MTLEIRPSQILAGVAAGALLGGGAAFADGKATGVHGCANNRSHVLTVQARCPKGTTALTWNVSGPRGAAGARGATGTAGTAATVSVGTVSTSAPGSQASVTDVGSGSDAKLDFTIPAGQSGTNGTNGTDGTDGTDTGPTAYGQVWVGSSTAELAPGNNANLTDVAWAGIGMAAVDVEGCSSAGLTEPVITVTADHDPGDTLTGADNTTNTAVAWVAHWSTVPDFPILAVEVQTTNPTSGTAVDSDFSITVTC